MLKSWHGFPDSFEFRTCASPSCKLCGIGRADCSCGVMASVTFVEDMHPKPVVRWPQQWHSLISGQAALPKAAGFCCWEGQRNGCCRPFSLCDASLEHACVSSCVLLPLIRTSVKARISVSSTTRVQNMTFIQQTKQLKSQDTLTGHPFAKCTLLKSRPSPAALVEGCLLCGHHRALEAWARARIRESSQATLSTFAPTISGLNALLTLAHAFSPM